MISIFDFIVIKIIGRIEFSSIRYLFTGKSYSLTRKDINKVCKSLETNRCFGLLRRSNHFTTYLIGASHWFLTGKFGYWSHAWANVESDEADGLDIDIIEAVGAGVIVSPFWDILNADAVCLLRPKNITEAEFDLIAKRIREFIGKKYDTFFNIKNVDKLSCEELLYWGIMSVNSDALPGLNKLIAKHGNFTPDMIYSSGDFKILLEIRG